MPTKVNFFRMLGYSPGTFVEIIDLTNAIFKNLTLRDYHKELLALTAAHEQASYEWEQHVSVARAAGVSERQFDAYKGIYEKARSAGITMVETLREVAEQADEAIISMVRDYQQNVEVILGDAGLLHPGQRTGHFRLGGDALLVDASGKSHISLEDFAVAMIDELDHPAHIRQRFTVGY